MKDPSKPIEVAIGEGLGAKGYSLATAESCSGGLIAHRITNVPGASGYFLGGVVTYSNEAKADLLGVREASFAAHGAVSEQVAREMAEGARRRFGADVALAVTGVAGPGGGTPEKPVGLVYTALAAPGETRVVRNEFRGDREAVKTQTAERALNMLLEYLR